MKPDLPSFLLPARDNSEAQLAITNPAYQPLLGRWAMEMAFLLGWTHSRDQRDTPLQKDEMFLRLTGLDRQTEHAVLEADPASPHPFARLSHDQWMRVLRRRRRELARTRWTGELPLVRNLRSLAGQVGLNEAEQALLAFAVLVTCDEDLSRLIGRRDLPIGRDAIARLLGAVLNQSPAAMRAAMSSHGSLALTGLVPHRFGRDLQHNVQASADACEALLSGDSIESIAQHCLRRAPGASLGLADFPHLAADADAVLTLLRGTAAGGVNILLEGPPGTGKTEFARALAASSGAELYEVPFSDSDGDPVRGKARLGWYHLGQRLLGHKPGAMLLFDEAEDVFEADGFGRLFQSASRATGGKAWVNRALEANSVPAIWVTNDATSMDAAYLRRFDLSVRFTTPPLQVRIRVAQHHLGSWADGPQDPWLHALAESERLTPAQLQKAAKLAQALPGDDRGTARALIRHSLERSSRLLGHGPLTRERAASTQYDLRFVNADIDAGALIDALRRRPLGTFCLHGMPGSGKSAFARHVGRSLGRPVLARRASDLVSKWWGETERNLAEMFAQARTEEAILILDEADTFLRERTQVQHSWEAMEVNELLTQMEGFPGIFFCTTNLLGRLDSASLRRFDWKIRFDALRPGQAWALVVQEFARLGGDLDDMTTTKAAVKALQGLTAGDVATVVRQYELLGTAPGAKEFVSRLARELEVKRAGATASGLYASTRMRLNGHEIAPA